MKATEARSIKDRFHADEARRLTEAYRINLDEIYPLIRVAASKGNCSIRYEKYDSQNVNRLIKDLRTDGYDVRRETGYDQRDGDSWDYITISW